VTRQRLVEGLSRRRTVWSGGLEEVEFLSRLYDLDALPSNDTRFATARDDIIQHRVANLQDWDDDWIFSDTRFGLTDSDDALLKFLAEMLHPEVRTDPSEVEELRVFFASQLIKDGYEFAQVDQISGAPVFGGHRIGSGVRGDMKNLIFAANGPKPRIVLRDAINNVIEITENAEYCLVYDRPLRERGLSWRELTAWWASARGLDGTERDNARNLYQRLLASMTGNLGELLLFRTYAELYSSPGGFDLPALIPQVYLHYDPYTRRERMSPGPVARQRMDFLLLLPNRNRVVVEVDGRQHYADEDGHANTSLYAEMVKEDRALRLTGYEVYRFGGKELSDPSSGSTLVRDFFTALLEKHGLGSTGNS